MSVEKRVIVTHVAFGGSVRVIVGIYRSFDSARAAVDAFDSRDTFYLDAIDFEVSSDYQISEKE